MIISVLMQPNDFLHELKGKICWIENLNSNTTLKRGLENESFKLNHIRR